TFDHIVVAFFGALARVPISTTRGVPMRRSFASKSITCNVPAAAFCLCLLPLAAHPAESLPTSDQPKANSAPLIEFQHEPAADAVACRTACSDEMVVKARG